MKHKVLYGTVARSPCAYCRKHHCSLTFKQIKGRKCLAKQCWYLQKYETHEVWKQRALQKERKKANKQINDLLI